MGRHTYDGFAPVWPTRSGDPVSGAAPAVGLHLSGTTALSDGIVVLDYQTDTTLTRAA